MNSISLSRRDVLQLLVAGSATLALPAAEPNAPLFFNKDQYALLDCLTELIIPADSHSGGAHDAGVAPFIDRMVAESYLAEDKESWRRGLATINKMCDEANRQPFLKVDPGKQRALLEQISNSEKENPSAAEKFFSQLKETTAFVYYSSSLGIHQEMQYKGNVLLQQFVGYDVA